MVSIVNSFQSELLKTKRTIAFWMVISGAFFTPVIITIARLIQHQTLTKLYASSEFWISHWKSSWESMALFLLPLGVIMIASLITQLEYRNNTWKQIHALPLTFTTIFISKLSIIIVMVLTYLLLFNVGIYLSAIIPYLIVKDVPYPKLNTPFDFFLKQNLYYFLDCLPIVALQYLLSLRYKNFLVPTGIGFLLWVGSLASLSWKYGYFVPYTYDMYTYLKSGVVNKAVIPEVNLHWLAMAYFVAFTLWSYVLYLMKNEKG